MVQTNYCAFISYRHQSPDQEIAKALHTQIENYGIPLSAKKQSGKKKMGKVFRDAEELPLSSNLGADIEAALDASEWFIAICSPRYLQSRWCMRELEYFIEKKGRDHVLTVLVEGTPEQSFPPLVRYSAGDGEVEPLAANVCHETQAGRLKLLKQEKLRLLAPMLGLKYDDLKRRARKRRMRIMTAVITAALFVAAGVTVYLISNHIKNEELKNEAAAQASKAKEQSRLAAEQSSLAAEQSRLAAEQASRAEEQSRLAAEQSRVAAEQASLAAEQSRLAAEKQSLADEQARLAEEQRLLAVSNQIGELLEKAQAAYDQNDRIAAAKSALEACDVSEENEGMRREEVMTILRKTMLMSPFTVISGFRNQNVRLLDLKPLPDGTRAIGIENQNHVALVDFASNEIVYEVSSGNSMIVSIEVSPDGSRFLANYGSHATVWNTEDGSVAYTYNGKKGGDRDVANIFFWRDADTLLVQDWEKFYFVSLKDGSERHFYTMGDHQEWYSSTNNFYTRASGKSLEELFTILTDDYLGMSVTPAANWSGILIGGKDGSTGTILIDEYGEMICPMYSLPATFLETNALSPDGKIAIYLSMYGFIVGLDTVSGELLYLNTFEEASYYDVSDIAFSPDSERIAVVVNYTLYVIDARSGQALLQAGIDKTVYTPNVKFSADGRYILLTNQYLYVIDAETFGLLVFEQAEEGTPYNGVVVFADTAFVSKNDGSVAIYCLPGLTTVTEADKEPGPLVERYYPGDKPTGAVELKGTHEILHGYWEQNTNLPEEMLVPLSRYSREGNQAAIIYPDGAIELFDTYGDGTVKKVIAQLTMPITAFGMVGNRLVASDYSGRTLFYDLEAGSVLRILNDGVGYTAFSYSMDGSMLMALQSGGGTAIDVYLLETAELLFTIKAPKEFTEFAFTEDGRYAVGITEDGLLVADLLTDEEVLIERAREFTSRYR